MNAQANSFAIADKTTDGSLMQTKTAPFIHESNFLAVIFSSSDEVLGGFYV